MACLCVARHNVAEPTGADVCVSCQENLADVLLAQCGHRVLCEDCVQKITSNATRAGRRPVCPMCRAPMEEGMAQPARALQIDETLMKDADPQEGVYPYGTLLDFSPLCPGVGAPNFANTRTMEQVSEAVRACSQGKVTVHALRRALDTQLTAAECELAFIELNRHVDMHQTLVDLDKALVRRDGVWSEVARHLIKRTIEGDDMKAMAGRAAVTAAGDAVAVAALGLDSVKHISGTDILTNGTVLLILASVDVYRWSKGDITGKQLAYNVGEHVAGCGAAIGGAVVGASGGAALGASIGLAGGPLAPVTTVLGALLGSFLADVIARKIFQAGINSLGGALNEEETEEQARKRAVDEAATTLGIDLQRDGFALAKRKFRKKILDHHPDRARTNSFIEDNQCAARVIAAWQIVRGQYEMRGQLDDGKGLKEPETFVNVWVMKTRESANSAWCIARTWFGEMENAPEHHAPLEQIEQYTVYM